MRLKKLTRDDIDWMVTKREDGKTIPWLADRLNVSVSVVNYHLQKEGAVPPGGLRARNKAKPALGRATTDEERTEWAAMSAKGMTPYKISQATGRPQNTVSYWLRRMAHEAAAEDQLAEQSSLRAPAIIGGCGRSDLSSRQDTEGKSHAS